MEERKRINREYTPEFKAEVAEAYLSHKYGGYHQVAKKYNLRIKRVTDWVGKYKMFGLEGFLVENRGRDSSGRPKKMNLDDLSLVEQVKYLKMENEILKKAKALLKN